MTKCSCLMFCEYQKTFCDVALAESDQKRSPKNPMFLHALYQVIKKSQE